ncbi:Inosine-5'-monophosphate dehydrogenase [uncultured archaeon]|nr:Inosine-5'-monophosphate dehydrogenase [uncultured archaeon]
MKVSELMRKNFLCLDADDTLLEAAKKMAGRKLDEAPVVRQGKFIGTISSSDIAAALVRTNIMGGVVPADAGKISHELVFKHLSHRPYWLDESADLLTAIAFIIHRNHDIIPVLDKKKKLTGVVLTSDLQEEMAKLLAAGGKMPYPEARGKKEEEQPAETVRGGTELDRILAYVEKKGSVSADDLARAFKLPVAEVEEYAASLEKHGLLKIDFNLIGKMKLVSTGGRGKE